MTTNSVQAQTNEEIAREWVNSKVWNNGILLNVDASVNAAEFHSQYHSNKVVWDKVFEFLKEQNLDSLSAGKYVIDADNAYAIITEGAPKKLDEVKWESHRINIDLQYVIKGKERIDVAALNSATVTEAYSEDKDVAFYTAAGTCHIASPGAFFLFFSEDVHRPNIEVDGFDKVKKLVVKIKAVK